MTKQTMAEKRKIQKIGNSLGITLPSGWVSMNEIKKGDEVILEPRNNNILVIPYLKTK